MTICRTIGPAVFNVKAGAAGEGLQQLTHLSTRKTLHTDEVSSLRFLKQKPQFVRRLAASIYQALLLCPGNALPTEINYYDALRCDWRLLSSVCGGADFHALVRRPPVRHDAALPRTALQHPDLRAKKEAANLKAAE